MVDGLISQICVANVVEMLEWILTRRRKRRGDIPVPHSYGDKKVPTPVGSDKV